MSTLIQLAVFLIIFVLAFFSSFPNCQKRFRDVLTISLIERSFGVLKRRFHELHSENQMKPDRVCTIIVACCILHNIAIDNNEPLPNFEDNEPWNEEDDHFVGNETGHAVRTHITNTYFQ